MKPSGWKLLVFLWILLTGLNLTKAYHIDDTFHLEAAAHIRAHPLQPMSGSINWDHDPAPIYQFNQPPLFFYLLAGWTAWLGTSEIATHLLLSIFTFLALLWFLQILILLNAPRPHLLLALFAACPALVINQNLMVDVPLLAFILGTIFFYWNGIRLENWIQFLIAGILLTAALLTKYTALPVLAGLCLHAILIRKSKAIISVVIPLIGLIIWSVWNYVEFGSFHLTDRPRGSSEWFFFRHLWTFLACLGSMAVFAPAYFEGRIQKWWALPVALLWPIGLVLIVILFATHNIDETIAANALNAGFIFTGTIMVLIALSRLLTFIHKPSREEVHQPDSIFILTFVAIFGFLLLFAPFAATRHVLLLVPFILLIGRNWLARARRLLRVTSLLGAIFLSVALGISDWAYADYYRRMATQIDVGSASKVYSSGHWGWQWYSSQRGWEIFSTYDSELKSGDLLVFPGDTPRQGMPTALHCDTLQRFFEPADWTTLFSGKSFGSLYNSFLDRPPWTLSRQPIDTIYVCKVPSSYPLEKTILRIQSDSTWFSTIKQKANALGIPVDTVLVHDARWVLEQTENQ